MRSFVFSCMIIGLVSCGVQSTGSDVRNVVGKTSQRIFFEQLVAIRKPLDRLRAISDSFGRKPTELIGIGSGVGHAVVTVDKITRKLLGEANHPKAGDPWFPSNHEKILADDEARGLQEQAIQEVIDNDSIMASVGKDIEILSKWRKKNVEIFDQFDVAFSADLADRIKQATDTPIEKRYKH